MKYRKIYVAGYNVTYDLDYIHHELVNMGFETSELRKSNNDMVYCRLSNKRSKIIFRDLFPQNFESLEKVLKMFKGASKKKIEHYSKYTDLTQANPEHYYTLKHKTPYRGNDGNVVVPYYFEKIM